MSEREPASHDPPSGQATTLLIVDDDKGLRARVRSFLAQHQIDVREAENGEAGVRAVRARHFDAVLLDLMMPGMGGFEVVRRIRQDSDVPILMLTGKDDETHRVKGLEGGADDYIVKPFRPRELLARIRAVLRRSRPSQTGPLVAGDIEIDLARRCAYKDGVLLTLSNAELDILAALVRARGRVLDRRSLLADAGRNTVMVTERAVDVHVSRLRKKLGDDPRAPRILKTVHGVGYVLAQ